MDTQRIQKLITFSPQLYRLLEKKAQRLGVSFPEYIRGLAVNDIKKTVEQSPLVDEETEKQIAKGLDDIEKKNSTKVATKKDLTTYLESL